MQKIIGFVLLLCCVFSLYTWVFESDTIVVAEAGPKVAVDEYGNSIDANGFVVPEYNDSTLSGDFYDAASKPLSFINDVATAFDNMRDGITSVISMSTAAVDGITGVIDSVFNFNDEDSYWANLWYAISGNEDEEYPGGSRGSR